MIIVVEGPDNAGKTTLCQYIAKKMRAVLIKAERPSKGPDLQAYTNMLEVARLYSGIVVTDRHVAISEPIYGTIIRGGHPLAEGDIVNARARIHAIVYCRPPTPAILSTIADRSQMEGVLDHAERIIMAYDELFLRDWSFPILGYDYTQDPAGSIRDKLIERLDQHRKDYRW